MTHLPTRLAARRILLASCFALVVPLMSACNSSVPDAADAAGSGDGGRVAVTMGTQAWIGYGPWYIAADQGFDEDHGVDLDLVTFNTDADLSSAFASGELQAGNAATNTVAQFIKAGQPRTIVLFEDVSDVADAILAGPGITSVDQLKGRRVAFEEGTTSDILLRYALSTVGLDIDDVEVVPTPASSAGQALLSGDVDAAVTYEPYISSLLKNDADASLLYTAGEKPGLISDTLTVNTEWAAENPEAVQGLLLAWDDAVAYYRDNEDDGREIIARGLGVDAADLSTSFDGVEFYDLDQSVDYLDESFEETSGVIEKILASTQDDSAAGVDIAGAVDTSYGTDAQAAR